MLSCVKHLLVGLTLELSRTPSEKFAVTYFAAANPFFMPHMEEWVKAMLFIAKSEQSVSENNCGVICRF